MIFFIFSLLTPVSLRTPLQIKWADLTSFWHQQCLSRINAEIQNYELISAFTCGAEIQNSHLKDILRDSSLYHLFIVSGAHLVFLSSLLIFFFQPGSKKLRYLILPILLMYVLATRGEPPVLRAFIQILVCTVSDFRKWAWPSEHQIAISGLICLLFFPLWSLNLSLILSWLAALTLSWTRPSILKSSLALYFVLLIPLLNVGGQSPFGIGFNIFLAPVVGAALLPLTWLAWSLPILMPFVDQLMSVFITLLSWITTHLKYPAQTTMYIQMSHLWLGIVIYHFTLHTIRWIKRCL